MHKKLLLFFLFFSTCLVAVAQDRELSGTVVLSKDGTPLPGVSVVIKGTTKGAATAVDGLFTLKIPTGATILQVRSIGYVTKEVSVAAGQIKVIIELVEDSRQLGDIVVTGYSSKKQGELTSAITVVTAEKLNDVTTNDLGSKLQGKVAGLQVINSSGAPGSVSEIRLRGISSINASQSPLIVVDGIIGGNYDPNDVESVTVLKDAGATAIYGSQANSGVLLITTKKAKNNTTQFEFQATTGFRTPDFGKMQMMNSSELYNYQKQLYRDYVPGGTGNSYVIDILKFHNERPASILNTNTNWLTSMLKSAPVQNYYFSARGKTPKNDYYFGLTYYDEKGTFLNTDYKRANFRAGSVYHFTDKISLTNNINISGTEGKTYDYNDIYYAYLNLPWDNPYDANGNPIYVDGNSTFKWWSRDKVNPLNTIANSNHPYKNFDVNWDGTLSLPILPWLTFSSANRVSASYYTASTYYSPSVAGTYHGTGYLNDQNTFNYGGISTNLLRFNLQYGDHNITGLAGVEFEGSQVNYTGASGKGLPTGLNVLNVVSNNQAVNGYYTNASILSYLSQVNYSYKNRYFLTGSYRVDGSSAFPPGNRYASFPSVSGGWLASNEDFLKGNKTLDNLKLRLSYGITGNQDIGASRYLGLYSLTTQYNSTVAATPSQLASPNLTWESKHQTDAGIDIGLFKRLNLTIDAYHNVTKNLLLQVSQPLSVGFETRWENTGQIVNNGLEFGVNSTNIRSKNFQWVTDFNISFNKNQLQDLPSDIIKTGSYSVSQIYRNGGNLYEFYLPKWLGVNAQTGAPQWEVVTKDAKGNVTSRTATSDYASATAEEVGSALPKFQGGFNNSFRYKNFSLSVNAYFVYGNKIYNNNKSIVMNDGHEPYLNQMVAPAGTVYWTQPGDIATEPSPQNAANSTSASSRYIEDGSYINIRNVSLGYALPKTFVKRIKLEAVNLSITADNVYTFTKFDGQDPQTTITPGIYVTPGVSDFKYPNNHQYLFNINITF
ncbi:MAG: SusC/RagA family TonB-linked outer membrane protein [Janthinobacterium lividum]